MRRILLLFFMLLLVMPVSRTWAQEGYLERFEQKVTEFTLENGMRFLVIERHQAPVASFVTLVDVGSVDEPRGWTGIAHMLEHMAFKGTRSIGTGNWPEEKRLLERVDAAYREWLREKYREDPDSGKLSELRSEFEKLRERARKLVEPNEFARIIERNGGTNLNAGTSRDYTIYFCSLPANRMELWFSLESARLQHPVFREFYTEKEVIREERRMRVDSDPTGRLVEQLLAVSYTAHPYRHPTLGWETDLISTTRKNLRRFYEQYYVPQNMTVAIAGDVQPDRVREMARTYFGSLPRAERPPRIITREPEQLGERRFRITGPNQPLYVQAYHTVDQLDPRAPALEILGDILARGRTSRLYQELVDRQALAAEVQAFNGFPGKKHPSLFVIFGVPSKGVGPGEVAAAIDRELDRVKEHGVEPEELDRAQTKSRANLIRRLNSNLGLARAFAKAEAQRGGWRRVFTYLDRLQAVTVEEIQEVAARYLRKENRTVGTVALEDDKKDEGNG